MMSFIINSEPKVRTDVRLSVLLPFLKLQALSTGYDVKTAKGLKKSLRALNRSIILN